MAKSQEVSSGLINVVDPPLADPSNLTGSAVVNHTSGGVDFQADWTAVPGAGKYEIKVFRNANNAGSALVVSDVVTTNSFSANFPSLDASHGPFQFRVIADH